ncbi:hypothetical protein A3A71_00600 [Candidatus Berkelbacteria bacterium RIFCSPLOWO2_01_FULL_50_28]|uniref:Dockerin domain-containing protein n=1 Tax=Candidatus Berkelbacteria bacterium RIFCSPLOWO2_01_FULL_50_28 TaxID=1797471 RepID=A0A1F5EB21_9BACT|nr:MAG: hypothetical protein A2807_00345 [Candidatus Berkelbacteria bacterium RIFCSPHIGHO2_01_FULL_50_36]OGD63861.1 MAG: hypothetical protein A3F39_03420 [Candidatus Berkelbacteria bacterium RIFCSPHIGHO2_12_FULL_50_11]OGD64541.1 MAG: hypothetical protein A3A71_00600 [Candidatus Berkelbacteria bacterium RIFCSPLOWO2_01_FULL_50_28]
MRKLLISIVIISLLTISLNIPERALAFDTSSDNYLRGKYYNNLVGDADFIDVNSMTVSQIQAFLVSKGSYLARAPSSKLGSGAGGRKASRIIWDASHGYREASGTSRGITVTNTVSPMVLLVTLQKEQSLITRTTYDSWAMTASMGYGCPDSGGCDPTYRGFTNQVEWAAWQMRWNYEASGKNEAWWDSNYPNGYQYFVGNTGSFGWGSTYYNVIFRNKSTGSLYRYTPHVGYGNFNFWRLMIDWFDISPVTLGGTVHSSDDHVTISDTTYRNLVKISGSKASNSFAYYGSTLLAGSGKTSWTIRFSPQVRKQTYYITYKSSGGTTLGRKKIIIDRRKVGDVNGDGTVDLLDVSLMSDAWGKVVRDDASLNLNPEGDSVVDLLDISLMANSYEG